MLFEQRFRAPIARGEVTVTFRRWKRRQALAGRRYRTAGGIIEADSVDVIGADDISEADARLGLYPSAEALLADLRGTPELDLYRIRFHTRLVRLDRASTHGSRSGTLAVAGGTGGETDDGHGCW